MTDEGEVLELERRQLPSAEAVLDLGRTALRMRDVRCEERITPPAPPAVTVTFGSFGAAEAFYFALRQFLTPEHLPAIAGGDWYGFPVASAGPEPHAAAPPAG